MVKLGKVAEDSVFCFPDAIYSFIMHFMHMDERLTTSAHEMTIMMVGLFVHILVIL